MQKVKSRQFRQRLFRGHISVGIACSLLMYISVFFGMFAIFIPYIQVWEKPSRHIQTLDITEIDYDPMIASVISDPDFPRDSIILELPGFRKDPALRISHQFTEETVFDPVTGKILEDEGDKSDLGTFLNGLHYGRPLKKAGYLVFGFMSVGVMFLIAGGLMLIHVLKYKGADKSRQAVFSGWHRRLFTWGFPVFTIFVICGSVMCLSFDGTGPMTHIATRGEKSNIRPVIGPVLFPEDAPLERSGNTVSMLPVRDLIKKAQGINPRTTFQRVKLINWGDETARIKLEGYNPYKPFLNGITNLPTIVLGGHDAKLIQETRVLDRPWSMVLTDFFYSIHLLYGIGIFTRLLFALIMLACCFAIGFGVMLCLEKKARKFVDGIPFYHWLGRLSLAVMIGVIPATGLLFNLQWLLPFDLKHRLIWQQGLFFDAWLAALAWSFYRINSYRAAKEFLALGGVLFLSAPLLHIVKSGFGPLLAIQNNMPIILSVDLGLALLGILFLLASHRLPKDRDESKIFWTRKQKRLINA